MDVGGGAHTWYLCREGFDTYAFDGSKSAIRKLEQFLEHEGLKAHLEVKDALDIEYKDDFFDAIVDNVCIYGNTLNNISLMYSKVFSILKKGGRLFTSCFTTDTKGFGTGEELEYHTYRNPTEGNIKGRGTFHFWDEGELRNMLQGVGFSDIVIEPFDYMDRGNKVSMLNVTAQKIV